MQSILCPKCEAYVALKPAGQGCGKGRCRKCGRLAVAITPRGVTVGMLDTPQPKTLASPEDFVPEMYHFAHDAPVDIGPIPQVLTRSRRRVATGSRRA